MFMQRSKEKAEKDLENEKYKVMFDSEMPDEMRDEAEKCIMEPSFVPLMKLLNCRLSFGGMNPEIEKLMEEAGVKLDKKSKKMDGISDKEMANRYSTLVGTMRKKFAARSNPAATDTMRWKRKRTEGSDDVSVATGTSADYKSKNSANTDRSFQKTAPVNPCKFTSTSKQTDSNSKKQKRQGDAVPKIVNVVDRQKKAAAVETITLDEEPKRVEPAETLYNDDEDIVIEAEVYKRQKHFKKPRDV